MIGTFEVGGPKRPRVCEKRGAVNPGEGVLVFYMPLLDPLLERLKAGHHEIPCPPKWCCVRPPDK